MAWDRRRKVVLKGARAKGDWIGWPCALEYENGESGGDKKGRRRGGEDRESFV